MLATESLLAIILTLIIIDSNQNWVNTFFLKKNNKKFYETTLSKKKEKSQVRVLI